MVTQRSTRETPIVIQKRFFMADASSVVRLSGLHSLELFLWLRWFTNDFHCNGCLVLVTHNAVCRLPGIAIRPSPSQEIRSRCLRAVRPGHPLP